MHCGVIMDALWIFTILILSFGLVNSELSLASYYGDHMVLQKAPRSSQIWGYADKLGDIVSVQVGPNMTEVHTKVVYHTGLNKNIWKVMLFPMEGSGPYTIYVRSSEGSLEIKDVLFGDVWICSGQSNMQFTLTMVNNFSAEIADAVNYPDIRLFTVAQKWSATELYELPEVEEYWKGPNRDSVGHSDWTYFSAVCWLYGKYLYQQIKRPIGLVATTWGGTPVEAWSSQEAMDICEPRAKKVTNATGDSRMKLPEFNYAPRAGAINAKEAPQNMPTHLWKAMIHPLLNMTIYGTIWYQGEANAGGPPDIYKCRFPVMILDWRKKFNMGSNGQTDPHFPFGFVQLAPWRNDPNITTGFPDIRWHQTCDFGYVPNAQMHNTFMAVAMDLPDFTSPYNSIHPRDKQDVAWRLMLSALPVAYNITSKGRFQGPQITAYFIDIGYHTLELELDHGKLPIVLNNVTDGFEVCCSKNNQTKCDGTDSTWQAAPIQQNTNTSVTVQSCVDEWTMGIRYAWRESPCAFKMCAVYSKENSLPMAPFRTIGIIGGQRRPPTESPGVY